MYFGAHNGVFRIYPARQDEDCGGYDCRKRPWYVAASSGPKDVIIILDVSGSMSGRIDLAKQAANSVIDALTIGDHFGVVTFSSSAESLNARPEFGGTATAAKLLPASKENKAKMKSIVNSIVQGGGTNYYASFEATFNLLDQSIPDEFTSNCHKAILFLTDGEMTLPSSGVGR